MTTRTTPPHRQPHTSTASDVPADLRASDSSTTTTTPSERVVALRWTTPTGITGRLTGHAAEIVHTWASRRGYGLDTGDIPSRIAGAAVALGVVGDLTGRDQLWALVDVARDGSVQLQPDREHPESRRVR
jgi:hypothetical protein